MNGWGWGAVFLLVLYAGFLQWQISMLSEAVDLILDDLLEKSRSKASHDA